MKKRLSHTNEAGKARMVDVGNKPKMFREATASGRISLAAETLGLIENNLMKKGDVLTLAKFAGIQAAKRTPDLIPLCHSLLLNDIDVCAKTTEHGVEITATVKSVGKTGVEMEALTSVSVGLLTVYDMCKAVDKNMIISDIKLVEKKKERYDSV